MSDFAPEGAEYPKVATNPKIVQNSVWAYCLALLALQLVISKYVYGQGQELYVIKIM